MSDSPGKSKPTLESLLNDQQLITGKKLIERDRLAKQMGTSVLMIERHYSHLQVIQAIEQLRGTNTRKLIEADSKAADNYPSKKKAQQELQAA